MSADCYDVIVLGAGAAGMTASAVAAAHGLDVLLIEKSPVVGGTTAISGGMVWVPANSKMPAAGIADSLDNAQTYLKETVGPATQSAAMQAFLRNGDRAIRYIEENTAVRLRPVVRYPDYYPKLPGATLGGRVLEPEPFDGSRLGRSLSLLRLPLPEFTILGGMMVARADIPHFRKMGRSLGSMLRVAKLIARYAWQRLRNPRGTSLVLGNALAARLLQSNLQLKVTLRLATDVTDLVIENDAVTGVRIAGADGPRTIRARRGVVLATGGFSHNEALRARYLPGAVSSSAANAADTGDGILLAQAAGAQFREGAHNNAFWVPASRFKRKDGTICRYPHTVTDRSKPGLIAVTGAGRRFTNEARSYHDFVLAMLRINSEKAGQPAYLVCDRAFLWKYGLGAIKPFTLSLRSYLDQGYLLRGESLNDLARKTGADADTLQTAIARYNEAAARGEDPEFGRGGDDYQRHLGDAENLPNPCVRPIDGPPYFAVAVTPADLGTAAGLATDANGQVLDRSGRPLPGLYACGNDMASVMEGAYPGPGITLGPALVFGFLVGEHLGRSAAGGQTQGTSDRGH